MVGNAGEALQWPQFRTQERGRLHRLGQLGSGLGREFPSASMPQSQRVSSGAPQGKTTLQHSAGMVTAGTQGEYRLEGIGSRHQSSEVFRQQVQLEEHASI